MELEALEEYVLEVSIENIIVFAEAFLTSKRSYMAINMTEAVLVTNRMSYRTQRPVIQEV